MADKIGCFVFEPLPGFDAQLAYYVFNLSGDPIDTVRYETVVDHMQQPVWTHWLGDRWVVVLEQSDAYPRLMTIADDGTLLSVTDLSSPTAAEDWLFITDVTVNDDQVLVSAHEFDTIQLFRYTIGSGVLQRYAKPNPTFQRPFFPHQFNNNLSFLTDGGTLSALGSDGIVRCQLNAAGMTVGLDTILHTPGAISNTISSARLNAGRYDLFINLASPGLTHPALLAVQIGTVGLELIQADTMQADVWAYPAPGLVARLDQDGIDAQLILQHVDFTEKALFVRLVDSISGALLASYDVEKVGNSNYGFSVSQGVYSFLAKDVPTNTYRIHFFDVATGEACSGTLPELSAYDFNPPMVGTAGFERRWFLHAEDNGASERLRLYAVDGGLVNSLDPPSPYAVDCAERYGIAAAGNSNLAVWQTNSGSVDHSAKSISVFNALGQCCYSDLLSPVGETTLLPKLPPGWYALRVDDPQCPRAIPFIVAGQR